MVSTSDDLFVIREVRTAFITLLMRASIRMLQASDPCLRCFSNLSLLVPPTYSEMITNVIDLLKRIRTSSFPSTIGLC